MNGDFKSMNVDFGAPLQRRVEDDHEWSVDSKADPQLSFDSQTRSNVLLSNPLLEAFGNAMT